MSGPALVAADCRLEAVGGDAIRARQRRGAPDARRGRWLVGLIGTEQPTVVERHDGHGHRSNYAAVNISGDVVRGAIATMCVTHVVGDTPVGDLV